MLISWTCKVIEILAISIKQGKYKNTFLREQIGKMSDGSGLYMLNAPFP